MLNQKRIAKLGPGRYRDDGDGAPRGLYLEKSSAKAGCWVLRYTSADGRERWCGLGSMADLSLKGAREKARRLREEFVVAGRDPIQTKKEAKAAALLETARSITFEECARQYIDAHDAGWSKKHASQFKSSLKRFVYPIIGKLSVSAIDTALVLKCIEPEWKKRTETMSRTRGRIESVLDWATVRGYRTGENPARWRGHLEHILPSRSAIQRPANFSSMPYPELPQLMMRLGWRPPQSLITLI